MKRDLHPKEYRLVVFMDEAAGFSFLTKSTAETAETIKWEDGKEYPLVKIFISSKSHPFFTGEEKIIDTEGRVDRFAAKMKAAAEHKAKQAARAGAKTAEKVEKNVDPTAEKVTEVVDNAAETIIDGVEKVAEIKDEIIEKTAKTVKKTAKKVEEKLDKAA
jgi:large subunit ribosomal protein L31